MYEYLKVHDVLRVETISEQTLVNGNLAIASRVDELGELKHFDAGKKLIEQDAQTNDIYLILSGVCDVVVNGRTIAKRGPRSHIGEMAAIEPTQATSADCVASEPITAIRMSSSAFSQLANEFPSIYRAVARELARRLRERNSTIGRYRPRVRIFIISSVEALPVARAIQSAFEHDPFTTVVWTDGVFKVTSYPLTDLEEQIDDSDFAIAIAHADDLTLTRGVDWPTSRDNVIFELGLFMGRLSRARAILMEPREEKIKLPSDLSGITTITYNYRAGKDGAAQLAPACNKLRDHINSLGPNNG